MKIFHEKSRALIQTLFQFERSGRYEEALTELNEIWQDKSTLPDLEGFDKNTANELLLRCGNLIGLLGHIKQIPNSQERSKNLLTEAYIRYQEMLDIEKIAECENYLAMAYWRTGELIDADTWVDLALSHNLPDSNDARLYANLTKSLIYLGEKRFEETILNLKSLESYFIKYGDNFLKGSFACNLGVALKNVGEVDEALRYYELARYFHKKSGHMIYLGTVENNLAFIYKSQQKFSKAHDAIDNAIHIFKRINDRTRYGYSFDTKALIYLDETDYIGALEAINEGILILEKTENADYLVETYLTKVKTLLFLDNFTDATRFISKAINLAETKIGEAKVLYVIKEYENFLKHKDSPTFNGIYTEKELINENIELIIPSELSHYNEIEGVWIKNKHLEKVGLEKGSLAIIVKDEVKRGDLVAISERDTEAVSCGFYDVDFGIICLQGIDNEPQLFDQSEIQILGKIVGVASSEKNEDGKMLVEPIKSL